MEFPSFHSFLFILLPSVWDWSFDTMSESYFGGWHLPDIGLCMKVTHQHQMSLSATPKAPTGGAMHLKNNNNKYYSASSSCRFGAKTFNGNPVERGYNYQSFVCASRIFPSFLLPFYLNIILEVKSWQYYWPFQKGFKKMSWWRPVWPLFLLPNF